MLLNSMQRLQFVELKKAMVGVFTQGKEKDYKTRLPFQIHSQLLIIPRLLHYRCKGVIAFHSATPSLGMNLKEI